MENNTRQLTQSARQLTKHALGFSWSLSLFSVQQLANMLQPSKAATAFQNVATTMQSELSDTLQSACRTGEALQNQMVDWALGGLTGNSPVTPSDADTSQLQTRRTRMAGWGPMPFPVIPPAPVGTAPSSSNLEVSSNYPFEPHYIDVLGSRMHYVDVGSGDPILLLHGNPTWSYLWRNIIPFLAPLGRCIAPDLIGFGRSGKPDIEYRWKDHAKYLEVFISKMGLRNITLVLHDQGSGLGLHYAMRHEENIKGIALFEAIIRPYKWDQFSSPEFRELFRKFRSGGVGGEGWKMIVDQNAFIEQLLPLSAGRRLTEAEMNYYREPFKDAKSRIPIWRFPRETPIGGEPPDVWDAVSSYSKRLQNSNLPKLLLYAKPGALVTDEHLEWAKKNIRRLDTVYVGEGTHYLQESSPHTIGLEVARWIRSLPGNESLRENAVGASAQANIEAPRSRSAARQVTTPVSAESVQRLIDQAAYFNLTSSPENVRQNVAIQGTNGIVGFHISEVLRPFDATGRPPNAGRPIGTFSHRWMIVPDDFVAVPGRLPPPTPFNPNISQRFVMLDGMCRFGNNHDAFRGFGTGKTFPTVVHGQSQLSVAAVGTIIEGYGGFTGHDQGTYVCCGSLDVNNGFTGNLMLRVMDREETLHSETTQPATELQLNWDGQTTRVVFRGQALPSDPVRPNIGPDGKPIGLIVEQGLRLQQIIDATTPAGRILSSSRMGARQIGSVTAHVAFDPQYASGTNLDPVPFTAFDEFEFIDRSGNVVGRFVADTSDGRVFNTFLGGQQAIRFGGVGSILRGEGLFQEIDGLMTDNSVVVFEPHVSASVYVLHVIDPKARFRSALEEI